MKIGNHWSELLENHNRQTTRITEAYSESLMSCSWHINIKMICLNKKVSIFFIFLDCPWWDKE